ncbi:MAG: hypothetical protein ABR597_09350 [Bacteroidales bacterium]
MFKKISPFFVLRSPFIPGELSGLSDSAVPVFRPHFLITFRKTPNHQAINLVIFAALFSSRKIPSNVGLKWRSCGGSVYSS